VITKGDIIAGLLHAIEVEYHAEEIHHYRASHFFEDVLANRVRVVLEYRISAKDVQHGGKVASEMKKTFKRLGIHPDIVRRAAIATYEAEMNVIIYAEQGLVTVTVEPEGLTIEISDQGPGIADVEEAMRPGFSTAPDWVRELGFGAGMGLVNIKNCAEQFDIDSVVDRGTRLQICIPMERECA
jgi:anti-sigma regulatory factor (Ser/Thr protein kinase)